MAASLIVSRKENGLTFAYFDRYPEEADFAIRHTVSTVTPYEATHEARRYIAEQSRRLGATIVEVFEPTAPAEQQTGELYAFM